MLTIWERRNILTMPIIFANNVDFLKRFSINSKVRRDRIIIILFMFLNVRLV